MTTEQAYVLAVQRWGSNITVEDSSSLGLGANRRKSIYVYDSFIRQVAHVQKCAIMGDVTWEEVFATADPI